MPAKAKKLCMQFFAWQPGLVGQSSREGGSSASQVAGRAAGLLHRRGVTDPGQQSVGQAEPNGLKGCTPELWLQCCLRVCLSETLSTLQLEGIFRKIVIHVCDGNHVSKI